ncbi:substrate-binding domain-containing protein [Candidatus Persebacteraceae bacterium Df01]|jgi:tungstate transport system substrate-binding protein|uniref:Substrate-binding domain-containing protein n=1 Tax=Candidatus Doriopsillibacter californiensis TaxID=2970740 RepID=A0ABT7QMJ1_9GAMM|nr:substrate-binding domain-containing protein [Candidatus Persebacteraceae bacterium Df01]
MFIVNGQMPFYLRSLLLRLFCYLLCAAAVSTAAADRSLLLAVTTSTENSGLLGYLLPDFKKQCDCEVRVLAVGSGKALVLGKNGDVDLLLTHAPDDEERFIAEGFGVDRRAVMYNDFVIVGPPHDPADIGGLNIADALFRLSKKQESSFISRGDESGTHKKERTLWENLAIFPAGDWYVSAGTGMGQVLLIANELRAYTLSDRGTYLAFRDKIDLRIVVENFPLLRNPYSVMRVNPQRHPHTQVELASHFADWLVAPATQQRIGKYRYHGEQLFVPSVNN